MLVRLVIIYIQFWCADVRMNKKNLNKLIKLPDETPPPNGLFLFILERLKIITKRQKNTIKRKLELKIKIINVKEEDKKMKNRTKQINRKSGIKIFKFACFVLFLFSIFFSNANLIFADTAATVNLTYSSNPVKAGTETITAAYSELMATTPNISIDQPGTTDISPTAMTPQATTWVSRSSAAMDSHTWYSVTYGNSLYVAIGTTGAAYSSDGVTWLAGTGFYSDSSYQSVTYGNGRFVAVSGYAGAPAYYSTNGISWTASATPPAAVAWTSVTYGTVSGNPLFVAVSNAGTNRVATSPDGNIWTTRVSAVAAARSWNSITYGNGLYVAISPSSPSYSMYSSNGIDWTLGAAISGVGTVNAITYGTVNGSPLFVGTADSSNQVATSSDGANWVANNNAGFGYTSPWGSITYSNGLYVMSGNAYSTLTKRIATSTNGTTWTVINSPDKLVINSIVCGNGLCVIVGGTGNPTTNRLITAQVGSTYTYAYTVHAANAPAYVDGTATVSLSNVVDSNDGDTAGAPSNNTFTIDTTGPTAAITYSINHAVKSGNSQVITATFNEPVANSPVPQISISGNNTVTATNMTKTDSTHYYYTYTVGSGNGTDTVALSTGTDALGNVVVSAPTSGATFTVDNTPPTVALSYSADPVKAGTETITAAYSKAIAAAPTVSINQQGSTDVSNAEMTKVGSSFPNITGLKLWLKADAGITKDGSGLVSSWADQSGNNYNATQGSDSLKPQWVDNQINGEPVLRFDGNNDLLSLGDVLDLHTRGYSMSVVYKKTGSNLSVVAGKTELTGVQEYELLSLGGNNVSMYLSGDPPSSLGNDFNQSDYVMVSAVQDRSITSQPRHLYANGSLIASDANGTNIEDFDSTWNFNIGARNFGNYNFGGDIAEIIYYDNPLSDNNRQKVETYLEAKYGIPNSNASGLNTYTYDYTVHPTDGTTYKDGVAAVTLGSTADAAGNVSNAPTGPATFTIDTVAPVSVITAVCSMAGNNCTGSGSSASPQQAYNVIALKGTTSDVGGTGVSAVNVSLKDVTANKYLSGTTFTSDTEVYTVASLNSGAWTFSLSGVTLAVGDTYQIHSQTVDNATNSESPVQSLDFVFTNSPPTVSNVTASQSSTGDVITVGYNVADNESASTTNSLFYGVGATLGGDITSGSTSMTVSSGTNFPASGTILIDNEIISYTSKSANTLNGLIRGTGLLSTSITAAAHTTGATIYIYAPSATGDVGSVVKGNGKTISWTATSDTSYENATETIVVVANDGASSWMIGSLASPTFIFDAKTPTAVMTFDAGVAGVVDSAIITIPKPTDISNVQYRITDDSSTQTAPVRDTGWVDLPSSTTLTWTFDSDIEAKTIKYQYRDALGNTQAIQTITTHSPVASSSFMAQDTSNIPAGTYDMYLGWAATSGINFASYKLEYEKSSNNSDYTDANGTPDTYSVISDSSLNTASTNFYVFRNLIGNEFYRFRLGVVDTNGNISVRSSDHLTTRADGAQNYSEGGGGSVATAPKVENVVVSQNADTKIITVNYKITDSSLSKKVSPAYEGYVFYNLGVTLSTNAWNNADKKLTLSNAMKLPTSGYIQVNNEVLKYTGKSGNILTGVTRGTWPTVAGGRTTRQNTTFFSGTPVWILANTTTPVNIDNNTITNGQDGVITWNTSSELSLAGYSYSNVGIRVLVHDNQDALSGPLSSQSDFSENGILENLDLTAPTISFNTTTGTGDVTETPVVVTINLSRAYPINSTVAYTVSGTAIGGGVDYTLGNGTATVTAGQTSTTIEIPTVNHLLSSADKTIILTLSSPTNATLGTNTVYTYTLTSNATIIQFDSSSSSGLENISPVNIPISISSAFPEDVSVSYTLSGTATKGVDYTLDDGIVTILAGQTTANISIPIIDDILKEEDETIILTLSNPINSTIGISGVYTYTIIDDDSKVPTIGFNNTSSEVVENGNTIDIPVSISEASTKSVTVNYSVTGGTAIGDGTDYTLTDGTVTIPAGQTTSNIHVIVFDNNVYAPTKTVEITLTDPVNADLGTNTIHTLSILDNEIPVGELSVVPKATSARISWTSADYTNSLFEYGATEGVYDTSKTYSEKTLEHNIYIDHLTPSTPYYFRITSTNLADEATVQESQFMTTDGPVISNIDSTSAITDTTAVITWTTNIPTTSYVNYSTDVTFVSPTRFGLTPLVTEHSVTLTHLNPESVYYFYVDGADTDGNIGEDANHGDYYTFTTAEDITPPEISQIEVPIITATQVAVTWTTNELADGKVMYDTVSHTNTDDYLYQTDIISTPLINHLAAISGLTEKTKYYYVVVSADGNRNKSISEEKTFTTAAVEQVIVSHGGGSMIGVAQELYDALLAQNEIYKARLGEATAAEPVVSNIKITDITAFGATVSFDTDKETVAFVKYGKDKNYGSTIADENYWLKSHVIKMTGLTFGTDYYFKINVMDKGNTMGFSDEQKFKTLFFNENLAEMQKIDNVEQFQKEIESTIESILPSLTPPFIDKPVVSDITENTATISFRTNIKSFGALGYTTDANYNANKENPYDGEISDTTTKDTSHKLTLMGLKSNTEYHFMAKAFSLPQVIGKSDDLTFMTMASRIQGNIIDVKKDSFTVVWTTDEPTSSIVEYKNLKTGITSRVVDEAKNVSHSAKIENLSYGTSYEVKISGINQKDNLVESGSSINVQTSTDNVPPVISNIKVESALMVGRTDKVQTIISWQTDEPSTSAVYYEEGSGSPDKALANKQENTELTVNHVVILTAFKPGTVYRFTVESKDDANNIAKPPVRTIITPRKTESIVDIIFKNFDDTFNFLKNVK